jgi:hypothetical protein
VPALLARGLTCALFTVLGLVAAPDALGDVFVPADPAPPRAPGAVQCIAGAGDVLVYRRDVGAPTTHPRTPTAAELDASPGQRLLLGSQGGFTSCPTVAAAADGTAVAGFVGLAGRHAVPRIVTRAPGGRFRSPLRVALPGRSGLTPAVAAAPGGWVAAAGVQATTHRQEIAVAVVAPDGTLRSAAVDAGVSTRHRRVEYSSPQVGIDASGAATVAWTRWTVVGERFSGESVRVARSAPGATAWEPARTVAVGRPATDRSSDETHVGLAVAPAGGAVLAWSNAAGLLAMVGDGGGLQPASTLATAAGIGLPAVAMTDDGGAVVAFSEELDSGGRQVSVIRRAAGGAWSAARRISGTPAVVDEPPPEGEPFGAGFTPYDVPLAAALAPGGRALVGWVAHEPGSEVFRSVAATGSADGAWQPARVLSIPTRDSFDAPAAFVDAAGNPRIAWIEHASGMRNRVHADRLADEADAGPIDTTAPVLTVALPRRIHVSRRDRIATLRLAVRCSEACDLRGDIVIPREGLGPEATARLAIAAGSQGAITFHAFGLSALPNDREPRHLRLRVMAADRAGNVTVRSRLVAVARR